MFGAVGGEIDEVGEHWFGLQTKLCGGGEGEADLIVTEQPSAIFDLLAITTIGLAQAKAKVFEGKL